MPWVTIKGRHLFIPDKGGVQTPLNQRMEGRGKPPQVVDPSSSEIKKLVNQSQDGELRGVIYEGKLYVGDAYHYEHGDLAEGKAVREGDHHLKFEKGEAGAVYISNQIKQGNELLDAPVPVQAPALKRLGAKLFGAHLAKLE